MIFRKSNSFEPFAWGNFLSAPFRFVATFIQFLIFNWSSSRNGLSFVRGLPALLGVIGICAPAIVATYVVPNKQFFFYGNRVAFYLENLKEYKSAEVCARKLVANDPDNMESHYMLGETLAAQGKTDQAREIMQYAARFDPKSSYQAHIWLAAEIFKQLVSGKDTPEARNEAKKHLEFVAKNAGEYKNSEALQASFVRANLSLAQLYYRENDYKTTETILTNILADEFQVVGQVQAVALLAQVLKVTGQNERLRKLIDQNVDELQRLAFKFPQVFEIWKTAVDLCLLRDEGDETTGFERARIIVNSGRELAPTTEVKSQISALSSFILLRQVKMIEQQNIIPDPELSFYARLGLLAVAIKDNPVEAASYHEILNLINPTEANSNLDTWLRTSFIKTPELFLTRKTNIQPDYLFVINVLIGVREMMNDNDSTAHNRWLQAGQQSALTPLIVNNFILVCDTKWPDNQEKINKMFAVAEKNFPDFPLFKKSQGEMFFRQGKFSEARPLLESVAKQFPSDLDCQSKLLDIYVKLGVTELIDPQTLVVDQLKFRKLEADQEFLNDKNR